MVETRQSAEQQGKGQQGRDRLSIVANANQLCFVVSCLRHQVCVSHETFTLTPLDHSSYLSCPSLLQNQDKRLKSTNHASQISRSGDQRNRTSGW